MNKRRSTRNKDRDNETLKQKEVRNPTISHNVIIKNVCDKSLLNPSVKSLLPPQLDNIYKTMINDFCFINNVQSKKKLDFYHCNISFYKGEETISGKRKALIEFIRKNKPDENIKKPKLRVFKRKIVKNKNKIKTEDCDNVNITPKRPYRKRKAPIKFENDDIEPQLAINEDINITKIEDEVINLSSDSSSCSSKKPKPEEEEEEITKSKNYFREPTQRKPPIINNGKKLKEHTLLDKIMLGINCVRQWTDRGLHLTKIAESDLGLLNKRLSSIKCTMSDLEEHTDENNNKSLSVFIQSEMFTGFTPISQQPLAILSTVIKPLPLTKVKEESPKSNVSETSVINVLNRHKTKQHIASMYRQKHNVPSILSKPVLNNNNNSLPSLQKSGQFPRFSAVKMENNDNNTPIVADSLPAPPTPPQWDSSMSASRLLKLKKSQNVDNNNIATKPTVTTEESPQSLSLSQVQNIPSTIGFINPIPTVIYQTVARNNLVLPLYMSPQTNAASTPRRTFCIPLCQPTGKQSVRFSQSDLSRFQPVPLKKVFPTNMRTASRTDVSSSGTQSTILKNLLQQSSNQTITHGNLSRVSSSHMVPLSVFQNKSKWQVGSIAQ